MSEDPSKEEMSEDPFKVEDKIYYSEKYYDDTHEYRHVVLPELMGEKFPIKLLDEAEWREIGVVQSRGWVHYALHRPEPQIMLFRRPRQDMNGGNPSLNKQQPQAHQEKEPNPQT